MASEIKEPINRYLMIFTMALVRDVATCTVSSNGYNTELVAAKAC